MRSFVLLFAVVSFVASAPEPRKLFHEHFQDFIQVIAEDVADELKDLMDQYLEFDEFKATLDFGMSTNFKENILEMESLPEFEAVVKYLETIYIDITYFLDLLNDALESYDYDFDGSRKLSRASTSGTDFSSFVKDLIDLLPQEKLSALYEEKMSEDGEFKMAMESLQSDEWDKIFRDLFENEQFRNELAIFEENGIDFDLLIAEAKAIFGQK